MSSMLRKFELLADPEFVDWLCVKATEADVTPSAMLRTMLLFATGQPNGILIKDIGPVFEDDELGPTPRAEVEDPEAPTHNGDWELIP